MDVSWKIAMSATAHCLLGCAIGEVLGMVIGTALGLHDGLMIALAVVLAFIFGYGFTLVPLMRSGMSFRVVLKIALAADTVSITTMEIVDNLLLIFIPVRCWRGLIRCSFGRVLRRHFWWRSS